MTKAEWIDRIATILILTLTAVVACLVLTVLGLILIPGIPHLSWHFLTSSAQAFQTGGGIFDQLFNSFYLVAYTTYISPFSFRSSNLSQRIRKAKLVYG